MFASIGRIRTNYFCPGIGLPWRFYRRHDSLFHGRSVPSSLPARGTCCVICYRIRHSIGSLPLPASFAILPSSSFFYLFCFTRMKCTLLLRRGRGFSVPMAPSPQQLCPSPSPPFRFRDLTPFRFFTFLKRKGVLGKAPFHRRPATSAPPTPIQSVV